MKQYFRRYGLLILVAFSILFPFVFYSTDFGGRRDLSVAERVVYAMGRPIELVLGGSRSFFSGVISRYIDLRDAKFGLTEMQNENARLKLQLQAYTEVIAENARLRQTLNLVQRRELKFRSCEIIAMDPSFVFRNVRVACGEADGVLPGMGVVSAEGIVGVVMRTATNHSDVLLITDPNSNLDVIVARNRRRGILAGNPNGGMSFKHFDRGTHLQVGDEVVASGLTGPFPGGLMVGRVSRIVGAEDGVMQTVDVEPIVNVSQLAEVLVLLQPSREVDAIRRIGGDNWLRRVVDGGSRGGG
jgi:rod shape-determining protein MreC